MSLLLAMRAERAAQFPLFFLNLCCVALLGAGCSGGFAGQNSTKLTNSQAQVGGDEPVSSGAGTEPVSSASWLALNVNGAISGGSFGQTPVLSIDKSSKELLVRVPMLANAEVDGLTLSLPIPQLAGARLGIEKFENGGSALTLRMPLALLMKGTASGLNPSRLPNGDPLPGVANGELPGVAVALPTAHKIDATVYLSRAVLAVFINTPYDPTIGMTFPVRDAARSHTYGYFATIPAKPEIADGGFYLTIAIPDDIARVIDDNI